MLERLFNEVKSRTRVVGVFPNREACLRLVTASAVEQSEEWVMGRRYLSMRELEEHRQEDEREAEGVVLTKHKSRDQAWSKLQKLRHLTLSPLVVVESHSYFQVMSVTAAKLPSSMIHSAKAGRPEPVRGTPSGLCYGPCEVLPGFLRRGSDLRRFGSSPACLRCPKSSMGLQYARIWDRKLGL
jgi:hypothetical protein